MGKQNPVITLAKHTDGPATRADGHLHQVPALQPALTPLERQFVDSLIVPYRVGSIPHDTDSLNFTHIVQAVAPTGLIRGLRKNAEHAALPDLVAAASPAAERQRFIGRERWNRACVASQKIQDATGRPPTALGSLAAMYLVYPDPAARLRNEVRFLVPAQCAAKARLAVADMLGVEVTAHVIPGSSPRSWDEAVRLRGSALVEEGWQLPTPEDAALLTLPTIETHRGPRGTAALVDLALLTNHPDFHWETFVQRAAMWRLRPVAWNALMELQARFDTKVPPTVLRRLEPSPWERLLRNVLG